MSRLDKNIKKLVLDFILKNITQVINAVFATVDPPKEAVRFLYQRLYFAYASEKAVVINNISKLEELSKDAVKSDFQAKMVLKITRPIVKINFLVKAESKIFEMMKIPADFDTKNKENVQLIINYADKVLSKFIDDMFKFQNESTSSSRDEVVERVTKSVDSLFKVDNEFEF
ncbi:MAG: hypothetical protein J0G32_01700 [Alphaproteobacteria bacterium]|nr:hypothetical protein [Alphaproteobacteria bacterium]OJV12152.1 MAG: hypothetical protein BGO27_05380 [Alphaproteobacteria bacterium 33-17]